MKSNIYRFTGILLILLSLHSCKEGDLGKDKVKVCELNIKDSLKIDAYGLTFGDKLSDNFLFFNQINFDIVVYNSKTKKTQVFNKIGDGYDEIKKIYKNNLSFVNDSVIAVTSIKSIKKYDLKGGYLDEIKTLSFDNSLASLTNATFFGDTLMIAQIPLLGNPTRKKYYSKERKMIFEKKLKIYEENQYVDFTKDVNDFYEKNFYYNDIYFFNSFKLNNSYFFINSNGKVIYEYDVLSKEIKSKLEVNLPNYSPLRLRFGKQISGDEDFINIFRSSTIYEMFESNGAIYLTYNTGYDKEYIIEFKKKNKGFPFTATPKLNFNLVKTNKLGEKLYVKIGENNLYPFYADKNDYIYAMKLHDESGELNDKTTIYICELIEKK